MLVYWFKFIFRDWVSQNFFGYELKKKKSQRRMIFKKKDIYLCYKIRGLKVGGFTVG